MVFGWKKNEAVFVFLIVVLVAGVSKVQLAVSQMRTRDAQRKADAELTARALERYFEDYKVYPPASPEGQIVSCGREGAEACRWGDSQMVDEDNVSYLSRLPTDPLAYQGQKYVYEVSNDRQQFKIYTAVEYKRDPDRRNNLTTQCGGTVQCNWYVESR